MATLGGMTTDIARRLYDDNNTAVSRADIQTAINDSIRFYKNRNFFFNNEVTTINMLNDDNNFIGGNVLQNMPSDVLYLLEDSGMFITYNQSRYLMQKVQPWEYDWTNYESQGIPYIFSIVDNQYRVYPYPDQNYNVTIRYVKDYTDFLTDGTQDNLTSDWTTFAEVLVRNDALSRLHAELRQDEKMAAIFAQRAQAEYDNLIRRTVQQVRTGRLSIDNIYEEY